MSTERVRHRIVSATGEVLGDELTFAQARAMVTELERAGSAYAWQMWAGERTGWNSVRASSQVSST